MANNKIKIVKPSLENRNSACPFDFCQLVSSEYISVTYNEKKEKILTKQCPLCDRKYIHVNHFKDLKKVGIGKNNYYNLNLEDGYIRDKFIIVSKPGSKQTVYKRQIIKVSEKKKENTKNDIISPKSPIHIIKPYKYASDTNEIIGMTLKNKMRCHVVKKVKSVTICENCGAKTERGFLVRRNKKGKEYNTDIKVCMYCRTVYVSYGNYEIFKDVLECENMDDLLAFQKESEKKAFKPEPIAKKKALKPEQLAKKKAEAKIKNTVLSKLLNEYEHKPNNQVSTKTDNKTIKKTIQVKDFMVRRSVFKCMHKGHDLQNIDAVISLVTNKGTVIDTTVSAGYCQNCNTYFILESTYQMLKNKGTPLCRISDEKAYLKGDAYLNGMKLASESLLMQYGYNVSQQEGLTETRRHKILALLIDNQIMTKSEIISYLDFFVSQRQGQPKYEVAIHKWTTDRDFVEDYKSGSYTKIGISGILW